MLITNSNKLNYILWAPGVGEPENLGGFFRLNRKLSGWFGRKAPVFSGFCFSRFNRKICGRLPGSSWSGCTSMYGDMTFRGTISWNSDRWSHEKSDSPHIWLFVGPPFFWKSNKAIIWLFVGPFPGKNGINVGPTKGHATPCTQVPV